MAMQWKFPVVAAAAALLLAAPALGQTRSASYYPQDEKRPALQLQKKSERNSESAASDLVTCRLALALFAFEQAEEQCSHAILRDGANAQAFKLRGYAYLLEHRFERAAMDLQAAIRLAPSDPESLAGYGESFAGLGEFNQSLAWFDAAIARAPRDARFWNARCWARAGTGRGLGHALEDCNRALKLAPSMAAALDSRGLVNLRSGRLADADADYTDSLGKQPRYATAWFGRGLARLRRGQIESGRQDILKARSLDPEIDALFVRLGVLAPTCLPETAKRCLEKDFPAAKPQLTYPTARGLEGPVASLLSDRTSARCGSPQPRQADRRIERRHHFCPSHT